MDNEKIKEVSKEAEKTNLVDEAKKVKDELKAENDRREAILKEEQKLQSENLLSSAAGSNEPKPQLTEEQLKKQQAKEYWKGTAIEDAIDKQNG